MVTPDEALSCVLQHSPFIGVEVVLLEDALGRTLGADIIAESDLPPFDNSAMDGYAVIASDVEEASPHRPRRLEVTEVIAAGQVPTHAVESGKCARIMTGALLPSGSNAVVMREDVEVADALFVDFFQPAVPGQSLRKAGSDVRKGASVMVAGDVVGAAQWGMLASLNWIAVKVARKPHVAVIVTGDEIISPGEPIGSGQIRDSNSFTLRGLLHHCGVTVEFHKIGDDTAQLRELLLECENRCDAIITAGGVSAGDFDPVRDVLPEVAAVHFWKIAMKPGKPVMFATSRARGIPIFGLPGNPVSVMVAFEQFVRPSLLTLLARRALHRLRLPVHLRGNCGSPAGKTEYVRAMVELDHSTGIWFAAISNDQGSGRLSTMTDSNALLVVPAEVEVVSEGTVLQALMTKWDEVQ